MKIIAQRTYPSKPTLAELPGITEDLEDDDPELAHVLKIALCSGLRIGEILNSYVYEKDHELIIRCIAEKKKKYHGMKFSRMRRGTLSEAFLRKNLDGKIWKSMPLLNLFGVDMGWLDSWISSYDEPKFLFHTTYHRLYKRQTRGKPIHANYSASKYETPMKVIYAPRFHFFRKAFTVKAMQVMKTPLDVANYMKWDDMKMLLSYYKLSQMGEF